MNNTKSNLPAIHSFERYEISQKLEPITWMNKYAILCNIDKEKSYKYFELAYRRFLGYFG